MTNGNISWTIWIMSDFTCKFFTYISNVMQMISYYTLLVFSFERAYVVFMPLSARSGQQAKFFMFFLFLFYVISFGINIFFLLLTTRSIPPGNNSFSCYPETENKVLFILNFMITSVCVFALPTIILLLTNLIIIVGILRAAHQRHQIAVAVVRQRENTKSSSATATLLFISLFQCGLYLPYSAIGLAYSLVATGFIQTPDSVTNTNLIFCYFLFMEVTDYTRLINFFVYYLRIQFFRDSINSILFCCCRLKRSKNSSLSLYQTHWIQNTERKFVLENK